MGYKISGLFGGTPETTKNSEKTIGSDSCDYLITGLQNFANSGISILKIRNFAIHLLFYLNPSLKQGRA